MENSQNNSVIRSDSLATSNALATIPQTGPEGHRPFTSADAIALRQLQNRNGIVSRLERNAISRRALLLRDQFNFVMKYGVVSINAYAETQGFRLSSNSLLHHLPAQLLLNINMKDVTEEQSDACQYEVSQLARALACLQDRKSEHQALSNDKFVTWYREQGRITGLAVSYLAEKRAQRPAKSRVASTDASVCTAVTNQANGAPARC